MRRSASNVVGLVAALAVAVLLAQPASAQNVTLGSLTGVVMDASGGVLPGATIVAVHTPTGTSYEGVTQANGRFTIPNVRVGGPYEVTVRMEGFRDAVKSDALVTLGEEKDLIFTLQLASVAETITVVGESPFVFTGGNAGTSANVTAETLQSLPTVTRSITDFARLSPHFATTSVDAGPSVISVAGRNNRYNNIQIDGAVNNDLFGLADSGSPGGQTESQPVSLDAIQEIQLVVAPYDVRQGMFSGGGVNAVTKSGTNAYRGAGYFYSRNQSLVGEGPDQRPIATFGDKQFGGSLGGPIAKNRAFFFGNVDFGRADTPSGWSISSSGQQFGHQAEADRFVSILKNKYGYDPGSQDEFIRDKENNKVFVRGDFNLMGRHQLTVRNNYIKAQNQIGYPDVRNYYFPDNFYDMKDDQNSFVAQVNSTFGSRFNEFRVTYQRIRDKRNGPTEFPYVRVRLPDGTALRAGRENFSAANELDQDVIEITDDFTMVMGTHTITVGTHNEFFKFRNLFIRDNFGNYEFASLDTFESGLAQAFDYSFSLTGDPRQSAKFGVQQFGVYAGDQWRAAPRFTLTYGVRLDIPVFPDKPTRNPASETAFGYRTDVTPTGQYLWAPRAGFNYDFGTTTRQQVRGGFGLFAGRTPYVWLSNQYGNTGIEFRRLRESYSASKRIPFVADPFGQPTSVGSASTNEIDLIDPDYHFPNLIRTNVAYDRDLGILGLVGTAEFLYSKTINDIKYGNLNLVQTSTRPDGRPVYSRPQVTLSDVIFLNNTDLGEAWSISFKLERRYKNGLYASGSYLYGQAKAIMDGTSSQAASNWGNIRVQGDPNNPPVTVSKFDPGHRVNLAASYQFRLPARFNLTLSGYYNGQVGRPYSTSFINDVNGDARTSNDLFYIPASAGEVIVSGGTWEQLSAYIDGDEGLAASRGEIAVRNASRAPWTHVLDFKLAFGRPIGATYAELTFDILNFGNMFNRNWGIVDYPAFENVQPVFYNGVDAATGKYLYGLSPLNTVGGFKKFTRDDLRSRWQGQIGLRLRF